MSAQSVKCSYPYNLRYYRRFIKKDCLSIPLKYEKALRAQPVFVTVWILHCLPYFIDIVKVYTESLLLERKVDIGSISDLLTTGHFFLSSGTGYHWASRRWGQREKVMSETDCEVQQHPECHFWINSFCVLACLRVPLPKTIFTTVHIGTATIDDKAMALPRW